MNLIFYKIILFCQNIMQFLIFYKTLHNHLLDERKKERTGLFFWAPRSSPHTVTLYSWVQHQAFVFGYVFCIFFFLKLSYDYL